jgi:hypothetical protein
MGIISGQCQLERMEMRFVDVDLQLWQLAKSMALFLENWEHDVLFDQALGQWPQLQATRNVELAKLLLIE